jgi:hypothetical protein
MSAVTPVPAVAKGVSGWRVVLGVLFMAVWIVGHVIWATMALMGTAMANDSGAATSEAHVSLMGGVLGGQVVAGLAGIPGGLAFFWRGRARGCGFCLGCCLCPGPFGRFWRFNRLSVQPLPTHENLCPFDPVEQSFGFSRGTADVVFCEGEREGVHACGVAD